MGDACCFLRTKAVFWLWTIVSLLYWIQNVGRTARASMSLQCGAGSIFSAMPLFFSRPFFIKSGLFGFFFHLKQCFSLTTFQPEHSFSTTFSQVSVSQTGPKKWILPCHLDLVTELRRQLAIGGPIFSARPLWFCHPTKEKNLSNNPRLLRTYFVQGTGFCRFEEGHACMGAIFITYRVVLVIFEPGTKNRISSDWSYQSRVSLLPNG